MIISSRSFPTFLASCRKASESSGRSASARSCSAVVRGRHSVATSSTVANALIYSSVFPGSSCFPAPAFFCFFGLSAGLSRGSQSGPSTIQGTSMTFPVALFRYLIRLWLLFRMRLHPGSPSRHMPRRGCKPGYGQPGRQQLHRCPDYRTGSPAAAALLRYPI